MTTKVTEGIKINVEATYKSGHSEPEQNHFVYSYVITISNQSKDAVQLLQRHWDIIDANGQLRQVEGEGVVGQQPVIEPGESYSYESSSTMPTEIGKMKGHYVMQRQMDDFIFKVRIPDFMLQVPFKLN